MAQTDMKELLEMVASGETSVDEAILKLKKAPFENIDIANLDHHRAIRQGVSEVIYGAGKTGTQINLIAHTMKNAGQETILITRMDKEKAAQIDADLEMKYYEDARIGIIGKIPEPKQKGYILVATGGTSDIPVAEEAALTAEAFGNNVKRVYDVGVAGIHRTLAHMDDIMNARVIITIAGMEGALASVVGGLADCPVIAVPTSVGYGTAFGGVTALLSMLNSCASGVSVVNIDNGFGAGYMAHLINNMPE